MGRNETAKIWIEGTVAPGFESVRELYEHNMQTFEERNTQLCIYDKGERVVDLWASAVGDEQFTPDSLVNVFSSGKSLESIALASLVGKGHLDLRPAVQPVLLPERNRSQRPLQMDRVRRHVRIGPETNVSSVVTPMDIFRPWRPQRESRPVPTENSMNEACGRRSPKTTPFPSIQNSSLPPGRRAPRDWAS
jgi:hypothetical protein